MERPLDGTGKAPALARKAERQAHATEVEAARQREETRQLVDDMRRHGRREQEQDQDDRLTAAEDLAAARERRAKLGKVPG
jgi:hypothetical protein